MSKLKDESEEKEPLKDLKTKIYKSPIKRRSVRPVNADLEMVKFEDKRKQVKFETETSVGADFNEEKGQQKNTPRSSFKIRYKNVPTLKYTTWYPNSLQAET